MSSRFRAKGISCTPSSAHRPTNPWMSIASRRAKNSPTVRTLRSRRLPGSDPFKLVPSSTQRSLQVPRRRARRVGHERFAMVERGVLALYPHKRLGAGERHMEAADVVRERRPLREDRLSRLAMPWPLSASFLWPRHQGR